MKKIVIATILLFSVVTTMMNSDKKYLSADETVVMKDNNFTRKLWMELDKPYGSSITKSELESITEITFSTSDHIYYNDNSFSDILHLSNLESITFNQVYLDDLQNIAKLPKLSKLKIEGSRLVTLSPLIDNLKLTELSIVNNYNLTHIEAIDTLLNLESLTIRVNPYVQNWPTLDQVSKLDSLSVDYNDDSLVLLNNMIYSDQIKNLDVYYLSAGDIDYIDRFSNITRLEISGFFAGNIDKLETLQHIEELIFTHRTSENKININSIKHFTNLKTLHLYNSELENEECITTFTKLEDLLINNIELKEDTIKNLENLKNVKSLDLYGTPLTNLTFIKSMESLENLMLSNTGLVNADDLKYMANLKTLALENNLISDIQFIEHLDNIEVLVLNSNQISDISPIQNKSKLKELYLTDNKITNVDSLKTNENLTKLELMVNQIKDISVLKELRNLEVGSSHSQQIPLELIWGYDNPIDLRDYASIEMKTTEEITHDNKYQINYMKGIMLGVDEIIMFNDNFLMSMIHASFRLEDDEYIQFTDFKVNSDDMQYLKDNAKHNFEVDIRTTFKLEDNTYGISFRIATVEYDKLKDNERYHILKDVFVPDIYIMEPEKIVLDKANKTLTPLSISQTQIVFMTGGSEFSGMLDIEVIPAKLEVQYLDQQGEIIEDIIIYEGKHNDEQVLETKVIDGYELVNGPEDNKALFDGKHKVVTYVYKKLPVFQLSLNDMRMLKSNYDALKASSKLDAFLKDHLVYELKDEALNIAELSEVEVLIEEENVDGENKHLVKLSGKYDGKTYEATAYIYLDESYRLIGTTHNMLKSTYNELLSSNQIKDYLISEMGVKLVNEHDVVIDIDDVEVDLSGVKENAFGNYEVTFKTTHQNSPYQITSELNLTSNYRIEARDHTMLLSKYEAFKKLGVLNDYLINQMQLQLLDDDDQKVSVDQIQIELAEIENEGRYNLHAQIKHLEQSYFADVILTITKDASDVEEEVDPNYQLNAKDIKIEYKVLEKAMNEDRLKTLILEKSEAKLNLISRSSQVDIQVDTSLIKLEEGTYEVYLVGLYQGQVYDKHIKVTVYKETEEAKKPEGELPKTGVESQLPLGLGILMLGVLLIKKRSR